MQALGATFERNGIEKAPEMTSGDYAGWLSEGLTLLDMNGELTAPGNLRHRALYQPLSLYVYGNELLLGLAGSGAWKTGI
jgi:hypothetical protein